MTDASNRGTLVVHLAAGQGTRLRPLTNDRPKPLVELGGTSMLERNVETLADAGVEEQLVVTGYRADQIRALGYETVHNDRYDETDMVYSLFRAREAFTSGRDLLISYGDIVYEQRLVDALLSCDAPLCVVVDEAWQSLWEARFSDPLDDAETLEVTADGQIKQIGDEPTSLDEVDAQYVGLLKVRADHLDRFVRTYDELTTSADTVDDTVTSGSNGTDTSDNDDTTTPDRDEDTATPDSTVGESDTPASVEMTHFIQRLVDDGWEVRAVPVSGGWVEVDTTEDLETYREWLDSGVMADRRDLSL